MSHFFVVAILPKGTPADQFEAVIELLMSQYSEELTVPEYDRDCYCIGHAAKNAARSAAKAEMGEFAPPVLAGHEHTLPWDLPPDVKRATDDAYAEWELRYDTAVAGHLAADPTSGLANPDCDECHGSGKEKSTYNPLSKWDWYVVGGRWAGALGTGPEYDPTQHIENYAPCPGYLCGGTGTRAGSVGRIECKPTPFHSVIGLGCNGCLGTGWQLKFASDFVVPADGNTRLVKSIEGEAPFAIVTPDGSWHERAKMGWFGSSHGNRTHSDWESEARGIFAQYADHTAVGLDCHI